MHRGGGKFQRQMSEMNRKCLPKPPSEFFEPSEVPNVPQNEKPEIFYVMHNLKYVLNQNLITALVSGVHSQKNLINFSEVFMGCCWGR